LYIDIDPHIISWLLIGGASLCAFMIGREVQSGKDEQIIESTISYLCDNNYVKHKVLDDGEIELIKLDEGSK
jgi:hypothetical protein